MIKLNPAMENTDKITSRDNAKLVNARKVRDGKDRSQIFIEGRRLAREALRSEIEIDLGFVSDQFSDGELVDAIRERSKNVSVVADRLFKTVADTNEPQGIVLIARRPNLTSLETSLDSTKVPLVLFLNEVNNPSNLGAILRTAEAAGIAGVIISTGSADAFSPKSIRASMGSSFRLQIWENAEFDSVIAWARERELNTVAADIAARKSYAEIDWSRTHLVIFGSEAHGLSVEQLSAVDEKFLIPMENSVDSLNLGVSAGIILFEAKRQLTS